MPYIVTAPECSLFGLIASQYRGRAGINNSAVVGNCIRWYFLLSHQISNMLLVSSTIIYVQHSGRIYWKCNKRLLVIQYKQQSEYHTDGLVLDFSISSALAMGMLQFCTTPPAMEPVQFCTKPSTLCRYIWRCTCMNRNKQSFQSISKYLDYFACGFSAGV